MKNKPEPAETISIADLAPNPRNPRTVTPEFLERLKAALEKFGDLGCLVFNRKTGRTVSGHQRIQVFMGVPESKDAPAKVFIDQRLKESDKTGTVALGHVEIMGTRYGYREVEWDEPTETAAMLAANQFAGEWDMAGVEALLGELQAGGFDMMLTGFTQEDKDRIHATVTAPEFKEFTEAVGDGVKLCKCAACGNEHSSKNK